MIECVNFFCRVLSNVSVCRREIFKCVLSMAPFRVTFLHPDLGIGGAERLVVDAALALKFKGYVVDIVTPHHDSSHSFEETNDGTLDVTVVGDWLPRSIFGRFYALCAYLRMVYAALYVVFFSDNLPDIVFCDQVSVCIPILHLKIEHVLFYCHFPDQLLSMPGSKLKTFYRIPLNWLEEKTTGCADKILVNSNFTRGVFQQTFSTLEVVPDILYPSINTTFFDSETPKSLSDLNLQLPDDGIIILSINRYERKKNVELAISAFKLLKTVLINCPWEQSHLVIAGGYDTRVNENVEYYDELKTLVEDSHLQDKVHFLKSPTDSEKLSLLVNCRMLVYTPSNEHFGIVPLEAMYAKKPVVAVNSGGPLETIEDKVTGFLCEPTDEAFALAMAELLNNKDSAKVMGNKGRDRFVQNFSFSAFTNRLSQTVRNMKNL